MEGFWIRVPATGVTVHHGGGRRDHLPGSTQQERAFYMSLVCNVVFLVGFWSSAVSIICPGRHGHTY
jgi:hypothetical protein